jgi:glycosyltransferase involved in cell wall biosynthesis
LISVLYDVSFLAGHDVPLHRTGIYRTVEQLARGLAASPDCNLTFCVAAELDKSFEHLASDRYLSSIPLAMSNSGRLRRRLHDELEHMTRGIETTSSEFRRFYKRAQRKITYQVYQTAVSRAVPVDRKTLAAADVFHSPYHALPKQMRQARHLKKFLTVYDLIPLRWPHLFEPGVKGAIANTIASLGPADFALCISESTRNDLFEVRPELDPERILVTPLGASNDFYPCTDAATIAKVKEKYGIPPESEYVLSLCTLEPRKNVDQAIRCFARVVKQERLSHLRLVMVGSKGWDYDRIFAAVAEAGIADYTVFTGFVADEDLAPLYSGALAFIYLSLYEGFGLPPLEAMKCGTAVITSNTSSLPEVVGDAGMMYDPADADGICQGLLDLLRDSELRNEMRQRSLRRSALFSWERCARETIAAYEKALSV